MDYPTLKDYLELTDQKETITEEVHSIDPDTYFIDLNQVPQVKSGIDKIVENIWVDVATAAALITIEIETSTDTWEAATIVTSSSPGALQAYLQISNTGTFPYSPRIIFNAAYAGLQARVSYTGWGSVPLAKYMTRCFEQIARHQDLFPPMLIDSATYNGGLMDGRGVADKKVTILPSTQVLPISGQEGWAVFSEAQEVDFSAGSVWEYEAYFTNSGYWKRIVISIYYQSEWYVEVYSSDEAATQAALVYPEIPEGAIIVGYVDIQNDNTIETPASLLPIDNTAAFPTSRIPSQRNVKYSFVFEGAASSEADIGIPVVPGCTGRVVRGTIFCNDSGSSGSTGIDVLLCSSSDKTGTTMLSYGKTVSASSNDPKVELFYPSIFATNDYGDSNWIKVKFTTSIATGASDFRVVLECTEYPQYDTV